MARFRSQDQPGAPAGDIQPDDVGELLEDRMGRSVRGLRTRVSAALPGAVAGVFLVTALAFGAALRPSSVDNPDAKAGLAGQAQAAGGDGYKGDKPDGYGSEDGDKPDGDKPDGDKPDGDKPDGAKPDGDTPDGDKPDAPGDGEPAVEAVEVELAVGLANGAVKLDWSSCGLDGFATWKVVRSGDEYATWPMGAADSLLAAIVDPTITATLDGHPRYGKTSWYRVFGLVERDGALVIGCVSRTLGIDVPAAPEPEPKPEPKPDPAPSGMNLVLSIKEGHVYVDWTPCNRDFDKYKVVRSTDATVSWPTGGNDEVIAAVGPDGKTAAWDEHPLAGKKAWYRVFCLRSTEAGYEVLAATAAKSIVAPKPKPAADPDPVLLGFEVDVTDAGIALHWERCGSDGFVAYKVVRSHNSNPSYLPSTDGSQVIAAIENDGTTSFVDGDVESGQTWYYRVQSIGWVNDHKVVLGQTKAIKVVVP